MKKTHIPVRLSFEWVISLLIARRLPFFPSPFRMHRNIPAIIAVTRGASVLFVRASRSSIPFGCRFARRSFRLLRFIIVNIISILAMHLRAHWFVAHCRNQQPLMLWPMRARSRWNGNDCSIVVAAAAPSSTLPLWLNAENIHAKNCFAFNGKWH